MSLYPSTENLEAADKLIEEAVLAERERCAKIAEQHKNQEHESHACCCGEPIAHAICKGD
jgi:hypothetical protein